MKKNIKFLFIFLLIIFLSILFRISTAKQKWESITENQGLPNRFIKTIKSDGKSVWIGTANGVGQYDIKSKKIKKITTKNGLAGNYITSIGIDKKYIWFGTDAGLSRYDKKTKKIINFTKQDGLPDNYITAIAVARNYVWVGTKLWGIARYDKITKTWKNFSVLQGLADNSINDIQLDGNVVWVGTKNGLSFYDAITGMWLSYDVSNGLPDGNIKSIAVDGEYIWCGTINGLARLNKYEETVKVFTTDNGLADDVIQTVQLDGKYLWIGTFSGVSRYDKFSDRWITYTSKDGLVENSISAIGVDGNYIWFGTDGSGISLYDKEFPQARISPLSYYIAPGKILILGTAFNYSGIKKYKISYKNDAMKTWATTGIKLLNSDNVYNNKLAIWNVSKLLNLNYDVKLEVIDKNGKKNSTIYPFVIDTKPPQLILNPMPEAVNKPKLYISGKFLENNLTAIIIKPDMTKADINNIMKQFSAEITLKKGVNDISIIAYDIANQTFTSKNKIIYDTEKPEIILNKYPEIATKRDITIKGIVKDSALKTLYFNPGKKEVSFSKNKLNDYEFSIDLKLQAGINKFQLIAYDYVGNKTVKDFQIEVNNTFPSITLNKEILKVNSPDFIVKGKWSDDNVNYISIEFGNKVSRAKISKKNKTFSAKVKLKEGENVITANIIDKDNNKNFDVMTVIYSSEKSLLTLTDYPDYTASKTVTIKGKFQESNLDKILLQPYNRAAIIDTENNTFLINTSLKQGKNDLEVQLIDKFGNKTVKKFSIIFDNIKPELSIDKVPAIVFSQELKITGTFKEKYLDYIVVKPNNTRAKINTKKNSFEVKYLLDEGKNELSVFAYDKAGNFSMKSINVSFLPKTEKVASTKIDSEYVKKLKDEIAYLKSLLKKRVIYKKVTPSVYIPKSIAVYYISLNITKNNTSLLDLTEKYLGSVKYINFINKYNAIYGTANKNKVLFPTKQFVKKYYKLTEIYRKILDIIAISYNYSKKNGTSFKKQLLYYLYKKGLVKNKTTIKNNTIKVRDIIISLNKDIKRTNSVSVFVKSSYMTFKVRPEIEISYAK